MPELKPMSEPGESMIRRVLARSLCMASHEEQHRCQVEAYDAYRLEAGLFSSKQHEAKCTTRYVKAVLQAYMADSSSNADE
jgi:hypothetical protein